MYGTKFQHVVECMRRKSQKHSVFPCIEATWCWCNYQQSFYQFINDLLLHSSNRGQLLHFKLTFWNFDPTDSLTESYNVEFLSSTFSDLITQRGLFQLYHYQSREFSAVFLWNSMKSWSKNTICSKLSAFRRSC